MIALKCKMCGGDLRLEEGVTVAECEYCGTRQTVPTVDDEKKLTLFGRANRLRLACEFDKAAGVYEAIVADFPDEAEAYWGLVLCKYGIEYVDDPATAKKIPTCHRSSFDSVMDDADFEQVMENADATARMVYREEAKRIEELRRGIVAVSSAEEPYDIFICYKETDANGDRTVDSEIAQDVYTALTERGYRVFFARISLEDKLGQAYEPYIFAALNSAKIMLVFGTDYEYFNAVWVKNEWSRFLQLIAKGESKTLIPCYKGVDAYDIPKEFAKLQAQDMGKVGALQDLLRGIEKILPRAVQTQAVVQQAAPAAASASNATVDSLLKRVFLFLEDEDWESADEYCEKVLDIDPENAKAYLGKLMVELRVKKQEALKDKTEPFDTRNNYQKAMRFADEALASTLKGYIETIVERQRERERAAEERKRADAERERAEKERKRAELAPLIKRAEEASKWISADYFHAVGVKADGTVVACGSNLDGKCNVSGWRDMVAVTADNERTIGLRSDGTVVACGHNILGQCNVSSWRDIVAVAVGGNHTIGLRSDGTVVACGSNSYGQCNVSGWRDIVAVAAGNWHTTGLRSDGTVVACGSNSQGQCDVSDWRDIVAVAVGNIHTIGLRSDGTMVACGLNGDGRCDVSDWRDIVAVAVGDAHTIGLRSDGTMVACGLNRDGQCNVSGRYGIGTKLVRLPNTWHDIVAVAGGSDHTIGLRSDGTVAACGKNDNGQCDVSDWRDIVAVAVGNAHTIGLRSDGTMVACGLNRDGQCNVSDWRLFNHIDTVEKERAEHKRLQAEWRASGVCQHCGGAFKGMFTKKCANCGTVKDY